MNQNLDATITSLWVSAIIDSINSNDVLSSIDTSELLLTSGIDPALLSDSQSRVETRKMGIFWREAQSISGRADIGLLVAEHMDLQKFQGINFTLFTSKNLETFLNDLCAYYAVITNSAKIETHRVPDGVWLLYKPQKQKEPLATEAIDASMGGLFRMLKTVVGSNFCPKTVLLQREKPITNCNYFDDYFCCDVRYSENRNAFLIDYDTFEIPFKNANPRLNALNRSFLQDQLTQLESNSVEYQIRCLVPELLHMGDLNQKTVAAALNMSTSSLHRKLKANGASYRTLVEDIRKSMASYYLEHSKLQVTEIAFNLGFEDVGNFTRAFKRWFGKAPSVFRKDLLGVEG